eukprot:1624-Heterococcus_DN1.PRE.1
MAAPAAAVQTLEEHYEVLQVLGKGATGVYVLMIATLQAVSQHLQRCIKLSCLILRYCSRDHRVKLGRTEDQTEVALKLVYLDAMTCKEQEQLDREVRAMQTLQETDNPDARFVKLQEFHSRLSHAEEGGQPRDVSRPTIVYSKHSKSHNLLQLTQLHKLIILKLVHRDLKLENVLLDEEFELKIADFGYAIDISNGSSDSGTSLCRTCCGTKGHLSPE